MEVSIRNKWISFGGSSTVKDMNEKDVLFVKGRVVSFTRKKFVQDLSGNTLFVVRNKFWRLFQRSTTTPPTSSCATSPKIYNLDK